MAFVNFQNAALHACSSCENICQRRQDAVTISTESLTFENVAQKIFWNGQFQRDIFHDLDGTLVGTGSPSWLVRAYPHLKTPECVQQADTALWGGEVLVCDGAIQLRKFNLYNLKPTVLQNTPLYLANSQADLTDDASFTEQIHRQSVQFLGKSFSFVVQAGEKYVFKQSWGQDPQ